MLAAFVELLLTLFVDPLLQLVGMHDRPFSGRAIAVSLLIILVLVMFGLAAAFLVHRVAL